MTGDKAEQLIREMHDRALIRDLLMRYGRAIDRRDIDAVAACFTSDAEYEGSLGKGKIARMLDALRKVMPRYEKTMHLLGTQAIELTGNVARCETYGIVYQRLRDPVTPRDRVVGVCYVDELACRERGWLITKRLARIDWRRQDDKAPPLAS